MDFASTILFMLMYYIRPQEWIGSLYALHPALIAMLMGVYGTLTRDKGFSLGSIFRTPHDWLMMIYFVWIVVTSPTISTTFGDVRSLFIFYVVIVHALSSLERIRRFLVWWVVMILLVAVLALLSEVGFDPMHSYDLTHGHMQGRLILNTSIFNNPNALGHSIVPALGLLYFLFYWRRFVTFKVMSLLFMTPAMWCIYLTESKGAFLSAFSTVLATLTFRRPWYVKVAILLMAGTLGWAAVKSLPRMGQLDKAKSEGGIQGRLMVFTWGLDTLERSTTGVGWGHFAEGFNRRYHFYKAPHSSYVAAGAELGWPGLAMFVGLLYLCGRTLLAVKTSNDEEERLRRALFVVLISYVISSWMVGWLSRAVFFIMVAVIAAYHRQMAGLNDLPVNAVESEIDQNYHLPGPAPVLEPAMAGINNAMTAPVLIEHTESLRPATGTVKEFVISAESTADEALKPAPDDAGSVIKLKWNRFGIWEILCICGLTYVVVRFWSYIMKNI